MAQRSELERAIARFRASLRRRDKQTADDLVRAYAGIHERVQAEVASLLAQIEQLRDEGRDVPVSWLYREKRLARLEALVILELSHYAPAASAAIGRAQRDFVVKGEADLKALSEIALGTPPPGVTIDNVWASLPANAVETLVGTTAPGSPVAGLLDRLAGDAASRVRQTMLNHVALGRNPRRTARLITRDLGTTLDRALTIARTESLRAMRLASQASMDANSDVVKGWIWVCALDTTTCATCIALHGQEFPTNETQDTHPNCRCTMVPKTASWADLGFDTDDTAQLSIERGADQFDRWPEDRQRAILGPAKYAAYRDGAITLDDLIGERQSRKWGKTRYEKSLREAIGDKRAARYYTTTR